MEYEYILTDDDYAVYDDDDLVDADDSVCDTDDGLLPEEIEEYERECRVFSALSKALIDELGYFEYRRWCENLLY